MKAVLLCRVSTSKGSQETSTDRQLANLEEIARVRRWEVVARFTETESGRTMNRRAIVDALDLVRLRKAQIIVVDHLFRFGRNAKEMLATVDELAALGGALYEAERHFDTTAPGGRLLFTILAAVGEFYAGEGAKKIREGVARARERGAKLGRPRSIDHGKADRARELRAAGRTWEQIAEELGGTRGAWSRHLCRKSPAPAHPLTP